VQSAEEDIWASPNIIRVTKSRRIWAGHVWGDIRGTCRVLVDIPEEKRPFGRTRRRWKDNIKMGWGHILDMVQYRDR
jgi:hypothetical protein